MKALRIVLLVALSSFFTSCNAPIVNNALSVPGELIRTVTGPIFGAMN